MKITIALLILSASGILTLCAVRQIKNHTEAVRQSILLIENIEIMLEYRSLTVAEIFYNLSLLPNFSLLSYIKEINRSLSMGLEYERTYSDAVCDLSLTRNYDSEDRNYMSGFLSMLGKSDVSGQLANCRMYKEFFKTKLRVLENDEDNRCRSLSAVIVGAGVMLSVIII